MRKTIDEMMEILKANNIDTEKYNVEISVNVNIEELETKNPEPETKEVMVSKNYLKTGRPIDNIAIATIRSVNGLYYDKKRGIWLKGLNGLYKTMSDKDFRRFLYFVNNSPDIERWLLYTDSPLYGADGTHKYTLEKYNSDSSISDEFKGTMSFVTLHWMMQNMNDEISMKAGEIIKKNQDDLRENKWKLYADLVKLVKEEGIVIEI